MPRKLSKEEMSKYVAVHKWLYVHYGKATKCEHCHREGLPRYEWANISGEYKRDVSDYIQLCQGCHKRMDHGEYCKRGHKLTPENSSIYGNNYRNCRICGRESQKHYEKIKRQKQKHGMAAGTFLKITTIRFMP